MVKAGSSKGCGGGTGIAEVRDSRGSGMRWDGEMGGYDVRCEEMKRVGFPEGFFDREKQERGYICMLCSAMYRLEADRIDCGLLLLTCT